MSSKYIPHVPNEISEMLKTIGVQSMEDLYQDIPIKKRTCSISIPEGQAEADVSRNMKEMAQRNQNTQDYASFCGCGVYHHYIPSVVSSLANRGEFLTAYTPYQPEVSQGSLQVFFEFQTMICELTGMDVANASLYDGATACAEAMLMACRIKKRDRFIVSELIHPEYIQVMETYAKGMQITLDYLPYNHETGETDGQALSHMIDDRTAGFLVGYPNFFGVVENLEGLRHFGKDLFMVVCAQPLSLAILKPPSRYGADMVVGEAQSFGCHPYLGGMSLGYMSSHNQYIRQMPGRIIGESHDLDGNRGFVMVLQTREQHIRRSKATSNICSNHAHNALVATIYLSLLGKQGLRQVAINATKKAHYLAEKIDRMERFRRKYSGPFFNEFVVESDFPTEEIHKDLLPQKILGPVSLERVYGSPSFHHLSVFSVTEANRLEDIDFLAARLEEML